MNSIANQVRFISRGLDLSKPFCDLQQTVICSSPGVIIMSWVAMGFISYSLIICFFHAETKIKIEIHMDPTIYKNLVNKY